jgi:hypothetical protein
LVFNAGVHHSATTIAASTMIPTDQMSAADDCSKTTMDYVSLEGLLGDAWLIIPFVLGMLLYSLRHKIFSRSSSQYDPASEDLKHQTELSAKKCDWRGSESACLL